MSPEEEQSTAGFLGLSESRFKDLVKDLKVSGNTISFTLDQDFIDTPTKQSCTQMIHAIQMLNGWGVNGEVKFSDVNCIITLDNHNQLSTFNMKDFASVSAQGQTITVNYDNTQKITQIGGVTITFPNDLDSYTEVPSDTADLSGQQSSLFVPGL